MAKDYMVKPYCIDFSVHGDQPVNKVRTIFQTMDASAKPIEKAGIAYTDASALLKKTLGKLEDAAREMARCWGDKGSVEAQKALQKLHKTVREFTERADKMGPPLEKLGKEIIPKYTKDGSHWSGMGWDNGFSWDDDVPQLFSKDKDGWHFWRKDNDSAKDELQKLNHDLEGVYSSMPDTIREDLPKLKIGGPETPDYKGLDFDPSKYGKIPNTSGIDPSSFNTDGKDSNGAVIPAGWPTGKDTGLDPNDTQLGQDDGGLGKDGGGLGKDGTGLDQDGTGGTPSGDSSNAGVGSNAASPAGVTDPTKSATNPRGTDLSQYQPKVDPTTFTTPTSTLHTPNGGNPTGGTPVVAAGLPGGAAAENVASLRSGSGAGGMGMPFMPMTGGAGAEESTRDEHSTWLTEDDDVWGGEINGAVNGTIA